MIKEPNKNLVGKFSTWVRFFYEIKFLKIVNATMNSLNLFYRVYRNPLLIKP